MGFQKTFRPRVWLGFSQSDKSVTRRLRVSAAHNEWNHIGIAIAALEEGFFAAEGFGDIELMTFDNGGEERTDKETLQLDLLCEGVVDIAIDPMTRLVLEARDKNRPVCIVAARRKNHASVLVGEKELRSIHDLRGKTVKIGQRGNTTDTMMRQVFTDHGLKPDEDVKFSYGGLIRDPAGVTKAFMEGKYGAAILAPVGVWQSLVELGYPILADLRKLYPSRHDRVTAANEVFSEEYPELLKGFLKGMIRGCEFVLNRRNKGRFKDIMLKAGFLTSKREQNSFDDLFAGWQERVSPDLSLPVEGIQLIAKEQGQAGKISSSFKAEHVLRLEALRKAQFQVSET
jgi:ABC-type nitrate/sulfonate/bicarbonate transport system substrate-binding protein